MHHLKMDKNKQTSKNKREWHFKLKRWCWRENTTLYKVTKNETNDKCKAKVVTENIIQRYAIKNPIKSILSIVKKQSMIFIKAQ